MNFYLQCTTDCAICCRYAEFLISELPQYFDDYVLGLRVSLLPMPEGFMKWKLRRDIAKILPVVNGYFMDIRIVDAGYAQQFHGVCPEYTLRKCEQTDGRCRRQKPVLCQARPLEIHLPERMQLEVLHFVKETMSCHGLSDHVGNHIFRASFFSASVCGKRGEMYHAARAERKKEIDIYQRMAEIVTDLYAGEWDTFHSEISRNVFRLLPVTVLLQALYETGRISPETALAFTERQKEAADLDMQDFLQEYGEKRLFPEIRRADGEKWQRSRGQYLNRTRMWLSEYQKTCNALRNMLCSNNCSL